MEFLSFSRSVYANRLRLLVAGKVNDEEAEVLIGCAADALKREGRAPDVPRKNFLRTLAEIQLEALERFEERDSGKVKLSPPVHSLLTEPDPAPVSAPGANRPASSGMGNPPIISGVHR